MGFRTLLCRSLLQNSVSDSDLRLEPPVATRQRSDGALWDLGEGGPCAVFDLVLSAT